MKIKSRRTDPELRLSWTLYNLWKRGDTKAIEGYLKCEEFESTGAMQRGKILHNMAEEMIPDKNIRGIVNFDGVVKREIRRTKEIKEGLVFTGVADVLVYKEGRKAIIDWKTGKLNGYSKQLEMYAWVFGKVEEAYLVKLNDDLEMVKKVLIFPDTSWVEKELLELEAYLKKNF